MDSENVDNEKYEFFKIRCIRSFWDLKLNIQVDGDRYNLLMNFKECG